MRNIWFTGDQHWGHANILKYCNRPFSSVEEMDEVMIERWNLVVKQNDLVYHLGDFTLGNRRVFENYIRRLHGEIKIIPGGHDWKWMGKDIASPIMNVEFPISKAKPLTIVLCHYPLRSWHKSNYGSLHLHGHSHGNMHPIERSMDVGVDCHDFYPISLDYVIETLR